MRSAKPALIALLLALAVHPAGAQEDLLASPLSPEDSVRLLSAARSDQANFERFRRRRLPETYGAYSSRCDERIGRFCMTYSDGRDTHQAPPEDPEVVERRLGLVDGLDQAAELLPGDGWIVGQRIRYLVEAGRFGRAIEAASECRAARWWCAALSGFAHHKATHPLQADSAFAIALASMDPERRDEWTDLSLILDSRAVRAYRRMTDEEKDAFEATFWRLADPLVTQPGNELQAEHFTRLVHNEMQERAEQPEALSWSYDLREILIRYGWPSDWERVRDWSPVMASGPPSMVSHYGGAPQDLLPPVEVLLDSTVLEGEWDSEEPGSRTSHSLPFADSVARWFNPLDHQIATFRRDDELVVVGTWDLPADSLPENTSVRAGLAILPYEDVGLDPVITVREDAGIHGTLSARVPNRPALVSVETFMPEAHRIARERRGMDVRPLPRGLIGVSDLLLVNGAELPATLEEALESARPSTRVESGEQVGVFWEIYGADPEDTPSLTAELRLLGGRTGWLRRIAERAGLLQEVNPVRIRWSETIADAPFTARSLAITIPEIDPGTYTLELSFEAPGREPLTVRQDIQVARPD